MKKVVLSACILVMTWSLGFGQGVSPELSIDKPSDGLLTRQDTVDVSGSFFPPSRSTVIKINGEKVEVQPRGKFRTSVALTEGINDIIITARNKPGNTHKVIRQVTLDTTPPEITIVSPSESSFTNQQQVTVNGSLSEPVSTLTLNDEAVMVHPDSSFSATVDISEGSNEFIIQATDLVGNSASKTLTVTGDFHPPETSVAIALGDPSDPATEILDAGHNDTLTIDRSSVYLMGEVYDALTEVEVAINSVAVPTEKVDSLYAFEEQVDLDQELKVFDILASDQAGNTTTKSIYITKPETYPHISVKDYYETENSTIIITGSVTDTTESVSLTIDNRPVSVSSNGEFKQKLSLFPGDNFFWIKAVNANGGEDTRSVKVVWNYNTTPPSDPEEVASELDSTVVTTMQASTKFLYEGDDPIQRGVEKDTIEARRASVVKGKVLDKSGSPLSGVVITVLDHPELGYTITREDGRFDMAVNGGGTLTLQYEKDEYLSVQRQVDTPWQDYTEAEQVVMVQLDPNVTTIDFSDSVEVAQGSIESDADGSRQATLMFEQGTNATMVMPDGSTRTLSSLDVRATEYTVGENGPESMPAKLPPTSGYTYAVEFSVDEALEAGASDVTFDKPVATYVDNFIGFPVGTAVPAGYYDRKKGKWIGSEDGRVIAITNITNGLAEVDINGDGTAEADSSLLALGLDQSEREKLASLYTPGKSLWRVEVKHFTPWDYNWPYGPPPDAERPKLKQQNKNLNGNDKSDCETGSIIRVENQSLGEGVNITGGPCGLYYSSALTKGFKNKYVLPVKLSDNTIPGSAQKIRLRISVAGTTFDSTFAARPNLTYNYEWDGKDVYGRKVQGVQKAKVYIGYIYKVQYYSTREGFKNSFGKTGTQPL